MSLLEHVEQADLDLRGQIGQLVHAEDAAIAPRDQAKVHGQLARQIPPLGVLDHVDLADQVRDRHVRRGELFVITSFGADPLDRRVVAVLGDQVLGVTAQRMERIVVDLTAGDDRNRVVQEMHELAKHARLGLAAQAEEEHVVLGEDGVLHLRQHGVVVADDAVEERLVFLQLANEIAAHLIFDADRPPAGSTKLAKSSGTIHGGCSGRREGG
jgi:hypothetical protein